MASASVILINPSLSFNLFLLVHRASYYVQRRYNHWNQYQRRQIEYDHEVTFHVGVNDNIPKKILQDLSSNTRS